MKLKRSLVICTGMSALLLTIGYGYVFIAGAPQFDPPGIAANTGLTFQIEQFDSKTMGTRQYGVILPPGYTQHPQQRYPVIILLHGGHDDERAYFDKYDITSVLHQLYQQNKLSASIIITPDGNDQRGSSPLWDPQYYDGVNGKLSTLIGTELVQVIQSRYRTLNAPQFWAMGGVSSGGWGALNIGLRHLNTFHTFFSHSGYFTDSSGAANSPESFVKQPVQQRSLLRIYLDAGRNDTDLLASTQQFHQTLNRLGIANVFYAFPGGHGLSGADYGWNYFHKHLANSLSYVGEQFKQAFAEHKSE
ncbi:esterase family protein [Nostoc sp. FACHB-152]|uniref:alpha/beta hydrolase n=1 Tax=unclassified Nostoc TaxID=2593658 RepID=UPI00168A1D81|nr:MULTISPECIES: alpha/beta hydrolase-fold protein [unclassified Nostoc]MBD2451955.1 esterase family protein [Nostoc sp. FACHB-152]MBD2473047.1 esterase family protein [Nostoc sp. FACHB-145]